MQLSDAYRAPAAPRNDDWIEMLQTALIAMLPVAAVEALIDRVEVAQ